MDDSGAESLFLGGLGIMAILIVLAIVLVPMILYILSIQKSLGAIDEDKRSLSPGMAWLYVIPLFNLVWIFFLVSHLKRGYEKMHAEGRLTRQVTAGYGVGIGYGVCCVLSMIPVINMIVAIPMIVLWIMHWVGVSQATKSVIPRA